MNSFKPVFVRVFPAVLAFGLIMGGATSALGAEVADVAPQQSPAEIAVVIPKVAPATVPAEKHVALVDNRILAIGLGTLGGVAVYSVLTGGWGMGMGAARFAQAGIPGMAAVRLGGIWGGRWLFSTASGVVGALVGDWLYRSNHTAE